MTKNIDKLIQKARPRLRTVSPLSFWIIAVMAIFNILLATVFAFFVDEAGFNAPLFIVNEVLTFKFWGIVFALIGFIKLYALFSNNWQLARNSLFLGVSVKAAWMVALAIRMFVAPGTFLFGLLWITIALIQMGAYIWFMPPSVGSYKQRRTDRE